MSGIRTEYQSGDVVNYNGSSYVEITTSLKLVPTSTVFGCFYRPLQNGVSYLTVLLVRNNLYRRFILQKDSSSMVVTSTTKSVLQLTFLHSKLVWINHPQSAMVNKYGIYLLKDLILKDFLHYLQLSSCFML